MPNRQYYGSAPNAFAGGRLFGQDQRKRQHQENALNELIERFGPEAGDPTAWSQLQDIDHDAQRFPHELERLEHQKKLRPYEIGRLEHERNLQPYEIGRLEHERNLQPIDLETAQRGNAAGQALVEQYGVRAGDTAAWGQAQAVGHNAAMFPHRLGAMERETEAWDAVTEKHGPISGNPAAQGIDDVQDRELQAAALNAARWLQTAKAKGSDLGQAYDRIQTILPHLGIPAEGIAAIREQIISDPDSVDELIAMLSGMGSAQSGQGPVRGLSGGRAFRDPETGEIVYGIPMSDGSVQVARDEQGRPMQPVAEELAERRVEQGGERIEQGWERITLEAARMEGFNAPEGHQIERNLETGEMRAWPIPGTEQAREVEAARTERMDQLQNLQYSWETGLNQNRAALRDIQRALDIAENIRTMPAPARLIAARLPFDSNPYYQLRESVESLKANVGINTLMDIRRSGATLGQVPQSQLETLMDTRGRLKAERKPEFLVEDLTALVREYEGLIGRIEGNLSGGIAELQELQGGGGQPAPAGEDPELEDILRLYGPGGGR